MNAEVKRTMNRAMTVGQFIDKLETFDKDARLFFSCSYGDRYHTQQALPMQDVEEIDTGYLQESGYSASGVSIGEDMDTEEDNGKVIIIR